MYMKLFLTIVTLLFIHSFSYSQEYTTIQTPNSFSPNGDGVNDTLYVEGGPFHQVKMQIFNRWGEIIFTSKDQKNGWDGKHKKNEAPVGVYYCKLSTVELDGTKKDYTNQVTLLR